MRDVRRRMGDRLEYGKGEVEFNLAHGIYPMIFGKYHAGNH